MSFYLRTFVLLLLILNLCIICARNSPFLLNDSEHEASAEIDDDDDEYLIKTSNCKIPRTDIINDEIRKMMDMSEFDGLKEPHCHYINDIYKPTLIGSNQTSIFVLPNATRFYLTSQNDDLRCSYTPFWKAEPDDRKYNVEYGEPINFNDSITIPPTLEFIQVICSSNEKRIYEDYLAFVPKKSAFLVSSQPKLNVLIIAIDSLSRGNFHRQMRQTESILEKLNFVEYLGYNKLGVNTFPNLVPLLTGYPTTELRYICWPEIVSYFDECPFIWQDYKQNGYLTAYIEEQAWLGTFCPYYNDRSGFINSPTDYYYFPFDVTVGETISRPYFNLSKLCFGTKLSIDVFLDYCTRVFTSLEKSPLFGLFFSSTMSHDSLNLPRLIDFKYKRLFVTLQTIGLMETSVVILMGDHGLRFGADDFMKRKEGMFELKLPLFSVSFPKWFRQKYTLAYANFLTNSKRLTTHFDTYQMFVDLLNLDGNLLDEAISRRTNEMDQLSNIPRGISLFLPIPETRTCQQAGVPLLFCACIDDNGTLTDFDLSRRIADFLVSEINKKIETFSVCAKLFLDSIIDTRYVQKLRGQTEEVLVTITLKTTPGGGLFQALVEIWSDKDAYVVDRMQLDGNIIPLSAYGNESNCVDDLDAKFYCYCE